MRMGTQAIREELNMSQAEFSKKFDIPLGTVKNWDARECMPEYVFNILIAYLCKERECEKLKEKVNENMYV